MQELSVSQTICGTDTSTRLDLLGQLRTLMLAASERDLHPRVAERMQQKCLRLVRRFSNYERKVLLAVDEGRASLWPKAPSGTHALSWMLRHGKPSLEERQALIAHHGIPQLPWSHGVDIARQTPIEVK